MEEIERNNELCDNEEMQEWNSEEEQLEVSKAISESSESSAEKREKPIKKENRKEDWCIYSQYNFKNIYQY